jgi:hypothetical protein
MTIAQQIGRCVIASEQATRATEFAKLAHAVLRHEGKLSNLAMAIDQPKTMRGGL